MCGTIEMAHVCPYLLNNVIRVDMNVTSTYVLFVVRHGLIVKYLWLRKFRMCLETP